jgi:hypothetical protein
VLVKDVEVQGLGPPGHNGRASGGDPPCMTGHLPAESVSLPFIVFLLSKCRSQFRTILIYRPYRVIQLIL